MFNNLRKFLQGEVSHNELSLNSCFSKKNRALSLSGASSEPIVLYNKEVSSLDKLTGLNRVSQPNQKKNQPRYSVNCSAVPEYDSSFCFGFAKALTFALFLSLSAINIAQADVCFLPDSKGCEMVPYNEYGESATGNDEKSENNTDPRTSCLSQGYTHDNRVTDIEVMEKVKGYKCTVCPQHPGYSKCECQSPKIDYNGECAEVHQCVVDGYTDFANNPANYNCISECPATASQLSNKYYKKCCNKASHEVPMRSIGRGIGNAFNAIETSPSNAGYICGCENGYVRKGSSCVKECVFTFKNGQTVMNETIAGAGEETRNYSFVSTKPNESGESVAASYTASANVDWIDAEYDYDGYSADVSPNNTVKTREGIITLTNECGKSVKINITQTAGNCAAGYADDGNGNCAKCTFTFADGSTMKDTSVAAGHERTDWFNIVSKKADGTVVGFTPSSSESWLYDHEDWDNSKTGYIADTDPNETSLYRYGTITLTQNECAGKIKLEVEQEAGECPTGYSNNIDEDYCSECQTFKTNGKIDNKPCGKCVSHSGYSRKNPAYSCHDTADKFEDTYGEWCYLKGSYYCNEDQTCSNGECISMMCPIGYSENITSCQNDYTLYTESVGSKVCGQCECEKDPEPDEIWFVNIKFERKCVHKDDDYYVEGNINVGFNDPYNWHDYDLKIDANFTVDGKERKISKEHQFGYSSDGAWISLTSGGQNNSPTCYYNLSAIQLKEMTITISNKDTGWSESYTYSNGRWTSYNTGGLGVINRTDGRMENPWYDAPRLNDENDGKTDYYYGLFQPYQDAIDNGVAELFAHGDKCGKAIRVRMSE